MQTIKLMPHQTKALEDTKQFNRVAYYFDVGLGKTFIASEKLKSFHTYFNIVICQKSKVNDWLNHFKTYYNDYTISEFKGQSLVFKSIIVINYDLLIKRPELIKHLNDLPYPVSMILDESQYIKNPSALRTKAVMKIKADNLIMLSGTVCSGQYEFLYTQIKLLDWNITSGSYWDRYIITKDLNIGKSFPIQIVQGYKHVHELKENLKAHGVVFLRADEALTLPDKVEIIENVPNTQTYAKFKKDKIVKVADKQLIGETALTEMLYLRQLASVYNKNKMEKLEAILESTHDRVVIFYNWTAEFESIKKLCEKLKRHVSYVNGIGDDRTNYNIHGDTVTIVQYQAGSSGINLQLSNKIIYFSLPLSGDDFCQSQGRIRRIGQNRTCFYFYLITDNSLESKILEVVKRKENYILQLFLKGEEDVA